MKRFEWASKDDPYSLNRLNTGVDDPSVLKDGSKIVLNPMEIKTFMVHV